jgi:hypothetical protein
MASTVGKKKNVHTAPKASSHRAPKPPEKQPEPPPSVQNSDWTSANAYGPYRTLEDLQRAGDFEMTRYGPSDFYG